jgi:hypothetical protein
MPKSKIESVWKMCKVSESRAGENFQLHAKAFIWIHLYLISILVFIKSILFHFMNLASIGTQFIRSEFYLWPSSMWSNDNET